MPETPKNPEPQAPIWDKVDAAQKRTAAAKGGTTSIDELLAGAGVTKPVATVTDIAPAVAAQEQTAPSDAADGYLGAFRGGDGRFLHAYMVSDQRHVLPKKAEEMTDEDWYAMPISLTDGNANRIPQNLTVKFKDPQWAGHWFNRKADNGRQVSRGLSLGFVGAKREDCEWISHNLNDEDGAITDGDLVLMKIHKAKLYTQFLKTYFDEARIKGGVKNYKQTAESYTGGSDKVSHYLTPQAEREYQGLGPVTNLTTVS